MHIAAGDECAAYKTNAGPSFVINIIKNYPPTITSSISAVIYKGEGTITILIPDGFVSDNENNYTIVASATYGFQSIAVTSNKLITINTLAGFAGNITVTVTVTDNAAQSASKSFVFSVQNWFDPVGCASCNGPDLSNWLKCESGYVISSDGKWTPSSILNHDASAENSLALGAPLGMYIGLSLFSTALTESSNSLEFVIPQAHIFLAYPATELYIPDNYVSYAKSLGILKWDFKFLDFMGIDTALSSSFNVTSSKNMTRIDYQSGSMIVNDIYLILLIPIVIIIHIIIVIISLSKWANKNVKFSMILGSIKKAMAYTLYTKFLVYSSLFLFITSFWDILSMDMSKGANAISIIVAVAYIGMMVAMMVIYLVKVIRLPEDITETYTNSKQGFLNHIAISLFIGLKTNKRSRLYYLIFIVHRAIIAFLIMILKYGLIQLIMILILEVILVLYFCIVRPYQANINNILAIWNQIVVIISWFILIQTTNTVDFTQQGFNGTIGIILIAIVSFNLVVLVVQGSVLSLMAIIKKLKIRETPVFPLGIAALRRRNPGEKLSRVQFRSKATFNSSQ